MIEVTGSLNFKEKLSLSIDEILIKNYHLESIVEVKNAKESFAFVLSFIIIYVKDLFHL